jgi:hypothetical protein
VWDASVTEVLTNVAGKWQHVKDTTSIGEGKMFSPGNLRATFDNPEYDKVYSPSSHYCFHFLLIDLDYLSIL